MKARVKATGDTIEISEDCSYLYAENYDKSYNLNELEFLDVKEKSFPKDEPDYWEKLKHQYAGMAMQGLLGNSDYIERFTMHTIDGISHEDDLARCAKDYATALVNRLKEESKCEK